MTTRRNSVITPPPQTPPPQGRRGFENLRGVRIAIVGGGITGLSAAWSVQRAAEDSLPVRYTVLECGPRWGGKLQTVNVPYEDGTLTIETGADALLTRKPWALDLIRELSLEQRLIGTSERQRGTFVLRRGNLVPLPDGMPLLVPAKLGPFLRSPLFSLSGKLRLLLDWLIPARRDATDESLASFVRRRLGQEALDRVAEPLLAGIYNADSDHLSIQATFSQFPAMETKYGSLLRGVRANRQPPRPGTMPPFVSFPGGTQELIEVLVSRLTGDLRLNTVVRRIERQPAGYVIDTNSGRIEADAVILTTPANVSARLLDAIAPDSAALLAQMRFTSIGTISLAYRRADVPHPLDGYGVVIPASEGRQIDGITFSSSKWPGRAPDEIALLRVFLGGPHTPATMALDNGELIAVIRAELASILGIEAMPLLAHVHRWHDAYPQYEVGHLDRLDRIEAGLPAGILLAGNSYRGVGVPDCIRQGKLAAEQAISFQRSAFSKNIKERN